MLLFLSMDTVHTVTNQIQKIADERICRDPWCEVLSTVQPYTCSKLASAVIKSINVSSWIHPISKILGNKNLIYSHSIWSVNATIICLPLAFD